MITEDELSQLLQRAADGVAVPAGGPSTIRIAAQSGAPSATGHRISPLRPRELAFAGVGGAAVAALIAVLLTTGGSVAPSVAPLANATSGASHTPTSFIGVRSTPAALGPRVSAPPANHSAAPTSTKSSARDIVATGALHLSVRNSDLSSAIDHLESLAASFGGYIGKSDVVESGRNAGGTLVLDVPATAFQSLIDRARLTGSVRSLTTSDQDVTGKVVDLGAQLTALQDERSQLEVLLSKSAKVSDLLQVEDQIESVQSQIQQIQGEQRVLSQQIAFSALTVHLAVPVVAHHHVSSTSGFSHAWHVAVSSFVDAVKDLVSVLGDIAFAILAALCALGIAYATWRKGWPRFRRRFA